MGLATGLELSPSILAGKFYHPRAEVSDIDRATVIQALFVDFDSIKGSLPQVFQSNWKACRKEMSLLLIEHEPLAKTRFSAW